MDTVSKLHPAEPMHSVDEESYAEAGYKGVQIELPTVENYLQELQIGPARTVTAHLAEKLYPLPVRNPLPNSIRSYYLGPAAKTIHGASPNLPPSPSSSKYDSVGSRLHSPPKGPPTGTAAATLPSTATAKAAQTTAAATTVTPASTAAAAAAAAAAGEAGDVVPDRLRLFEPLPPIPRRHSPSRRHKTPSPNRPTRHVVAAVVERAADASTTAGIPAEDENAPAAAIAADATNRDVCSDGISRAAHVSKYVTGVSKVMEKVAAGIAYLEKAKQMQGGTQPATGLMQAFSDASSGQGGAATPRRARVFKRNATAAGAGCANDAAVVRVWSRVQLPPGPQQRVQGSGKGEGAAIMQVVLTKQGLLKTDMRRILDQLDHFQGQDGALVQGLADAMTVFSYPPNSLLYARGTVCDELMVLLSGQVVFQPDGAGACVRLPPGTVLGVELMTQRLLAPCDIRTDPNFNCQIAVLSWQVYGDQLRAWAADKVLSHMPGLQFSAEARVRAAIAKHAIHKHCQAGKPVYSEHDPADSLVLLVKGQVVVSQLVEDTTQTEGQVAQQLQATLVGVTDLIVPAEIPRLPQHHTSQTGAHMPRGVRASAVVHGKLVAAADKPIVQGELPVACQVVHEPAAAAETTSAAGIANGVEASDAIESRSAVNSSAWQQAEAVQGGQTEHGVIGAAEGADLVDAAASGVGDVCDGMQGHGTQSEAAALLPAERLLPDQASLSALEHEASLSLGASDLTHMSTPVEGRLHLRSPNTHIIVQAQDGVEAGGSASPEQLEHGIGAAQQPTCNTDRPQESPGVEAFDFNASGRAQQDKDAVGHVSADTDDIPVSVGQLEAVPSLALLGNGGPSMHVSTAAAPDGVRDQEQEVSILMSEPVFGVDSIGAATPQCSSPTALSVMATPSQCSATVAGVGAATDADGVRVFELLSKSPTSDGYASDTASDRTGVTCSAGAEKTQGHDGSGHPHHLSLLQKLTGHSETGGDGVISHASPVHGSEHPPAKHHLLRDQISMKHNSKGGTASESAQHLAQPEAASHTAVPEAASLDGSISTKVVAAGPKAQPAAKKTSKNNNLPAGTKPSDEERKLSVTGSDGVQAQSEPIQPPERVLPQLKGVPLHNALAAVLKANRQQVLAVHTTSIFLGEECTGVEAGDSRHSGYHHTVLAAQPVEVLCIPKALLLGSLPFRMPEELQKRAAAQRTRAAFKKTAGAIPQGARQWPDAAPMLKALLATPAGSRAQWQVEQLADAFSSIPALAALPWQARVRVFQDLAFKQLGPDSPGLLLAQTLYQAVPAGGRQSSQPGVDELPVQISDAFLEGLPSDIERSQISETGQSQVSDMGHPQLSVEPDASTQQSSVRPGGVMSDAHQKEQPFRGGALKDPQSWFACAEGDLSPVNDTIRLPSTQFSNEDQQQLPAVPDLQHEDDRSESPLHAFLQQAQKHARPADDTGDDAETHSADLMLESPVSFPTLPTPGSPSLLVPRLALQSMDRTGTRGSLLASGSMCGWDEANGASRPLSGITQSLPLELPSHSPHALSAHHHIAQLSLSQQQQSMQLGVDSQRSSAVDEGSVALSSGRLPEAGNGLAAGAGAVPQQQQNTSSMQAATGMQAGGCTTFTLQAVNLKKDDQLYIVISGEAAIAAVLTPDNAEAAIAAVQQAQQAASTHVPSVPWCNPLEPVILANVGLGSTLSAAQALELSELQPPGSMTAVDSLREAAAALTVSGTAPELVPAIPGTRQVLAVQQGPQPLELLFMSRPLFALALNGAGRAANAQEIADCLEHCATWASSLWQEFSGSSARDSAAAQLGPDTVANKLLGCCRVEEFQQGTELLRRGEPAPVLYVIMGGECALHASYVGLAEADGAGAAALHELTRMKVGSSCGELSLLAARPLWYSMVVASPHATLLSIDLPSLRHLVATNLTPQGADRLLRAVAANDLKMYATAIHKQALLVAAGTLDLGLFQPAARSLLLQVMELGDLQQSEASGNQAGGACAGKPSAVVIEDANKVNDLVSSLSRPYFAPPNVHERAAVFKAELRAQHVAAAQSVLDEGSDITNVPAGLPVAMGVGAALLQQSLALYHTSHTPTAGSLSGGGIDDSVLHISMPAASTEELAYKRPCPVRPPRQFDRRPLPKSLRGSEVEFNSRPVEHMLPLSVLTAQQVLDLVRVRVHVKPSALSQVSELVWAHRPSTPQAAAISNADSIKHAQGTSIHQRPWSASSCQQPNRHFETTMLNTGHMQSTVTNAGEIQVEVEARRLCRASASMLFPQSFARRTMRRASHVDPINPTTVAASPHSKLRASRTTFAEPPGDHGDDAEPAVGWAAHPKVLPAIRARVQSSVYRQVAAAASIKLRAKRTMHRSLTAAMWDDSDNALEELLAGDGGVYDDVDEEQELQGSDEMHHSMQQPDVSAQREGTGTATVRHTHNEGMQVQDMPIVPRLNMAAGKQAFATSSEGLAVSDEQVPESSLIGSANVRENVGLAEQHTGEAQLSEPAAAAAAAAAAVAAAESSLPRSLQSPSAGSLSNASMHPEVSFAMSGKVVSSSIGAASAEPSSLLPQVSMPSLVTEDVLHSATPGPRSMPCLMTPTALSDPAVGELAASQCSNAQEVSNCTSSSGDMDTASHTITSETTHKNSTAARNCGTEGSVAQYDSATGYDGDGRAMESGVHSSNDMTAAAVPTAVSCNAAGFAATSIPQEQQSPHAASRTSAMAATASTPLQRSTIDHDKGRSSRVQISDTEVINVQSHAHPGAGARSLAADSKKASFVVPDQEHSTSTRSDTSSVEQTTEPGSAPAVLKRRGIWVRDAMYDPAGITNPLMAGLMTEAAQQAAGGAGVGLQVTMPAPMGSRLSPHMQSRPIMQQGAKSSLARTALLRKHHKQPQPSFLAANLGCQAEQQPCTAHGELIGTDALQRTQEGAIMATVDADALLAGDLIYVTMEVPPKVKTTPEVTFGHAASMPMCAPNIRMLPPAPKQGVHMAAAMAAVSLGEALRGGSTGSSYVPAFLKSKRKPIVAPPKHTMELGKQQWVVPTYSSKAGFLEGLYDEEAEVMYFDN